MELDVVGIEVVSVARRDGTGEPGVPALDAWVDRCGARPGAASALAFDAEHRQG